MSVNLSIKEVPEALAQRLRERAARNHRSLQGELMAIIEQAAQQGSGPAGGQVQGWKTIVDLMHERAARPVRHQEGWPLGVDIVRADRDSR